MNSVDVDRSAIAINCSFGQHVRIKRHVELRDSVIDDYSYVSQGSMVIQSVVGKFVSIGPGCNIGLWEHNQEVSTHSFYLYESSGGFVKGYRNYNKDAMLTTLGSDVWVGAGAIIKKGVTIGDGAIIGAGAVVTKDVEPYSVAVGCPARHHKYRFAQHHIDILLKTKWWNRPREEIQKMVDMSLFDDFQKFINYIKDRYT